jgi:urea transport system ATP-binding protein
MMQAQLLDVTGLRVGYGQSEVIPGLSFSAGQNEIVGVMGRNGMGETTLFKALIGLLPRSAGTIILGGQDLS